MKFISLAALTFALATGTAALQAQTATRLAATKANNFAMVYTLPSTGLSITLEAEITVKKPGEFYNYAKKYLNISDPITRETCSATLRSAVVSTYGVANDKERYAVTFKNGTSPYMMLSAENIPLSINTEKAAEADQPELPVAPDAAGDSGCHSGGKRRDAPESVDGQTCRTGGSGALCFASDPRRPHFGAG